MNSVLLKLMTGNFYKGFLQMHDVYFRGLISPKNELIVLPTLHCRQRKCDLFLKYNEEEKNNKYIDAPKRN